MAAAAAAAAAALAAAKTQSDKWYDTLLRTVGSLEEVGYTKFRSQLERAAFKDSSSANLTNKQELAERNAYLIIMEKTDGHTVASVAS
jgi:hypothetical protein